MSKELLKIFPLKVVAITSYTNQAAIDECYESGMSDVIHKPVSFDQLCEMLVKYYYDKDELISQKHLYEKK